jgi:prevent-host-death family protein
MDAEYSVYEAKAHFSELLARVREQRQPLVITLRGKKVARLVPYDHDDDETLADRLDALKARGRLIEAAPLPKALPSSGDRVRDGAPGALARFLESRDR